MQSGGLIWITGFSGAGKSTVASLVVEGLRDRGLPVILLDGDDLRSVLGETFGHDLDDRKRLAYVYARLCKKICDNSVTVVIATIAMFESVRRENRVANETYLEVYLDVPLRVRAERDPKGIYHSAKQSGRINEPTVGLEEPENPDLRIENFGETRPEDAAQLIIKNYARQLKKEKAETQLSVPVADSNTSYWDAFYEKRSAPISPSPFAIFCQENYFFRNLHILEFGCGNGRDSFFFAKNHRVIATDPSSVAIETNRQRAGDEGHLNIEFAQGKLGSEDLNLLQAVDAVYGRFVIHAMSSEDEIAALQGANRALAPGGRLFLEFRTDKDTLMEQGTVVSANERVTDHYRRFIDFAAFCASLDGLGFEIEYQLERNGLAKFGDDDPTVGRIVARKIRDCS